MCKIIFVYCMFIPLFMFVCLSNAARATFVLRKGTASPSGGATMPGAWKT
jgi:hypothetical protein